MGYILVMVPVVFTLVLLSYIFKHRNTKEVNIMEDVPVINISREALEKHALNISASYSDTVLRKTQRKLVRSFDRSFKDILGAYEYINNKVTGKREIVPAAEWLLDNFYLIEREYKNIKHNIPHDCVKDMPILTKGVMKGYPRIYHIAVELVSHTDGRIDEDVIETFINSYQKNAVLTTAEIWVMPIMLRIALIMNISRVCKQIVFSMEEKSKGERTADRILDALNGNKAKYELEKIYTEDMEFTPYFTEKLLKTLRDNGADDEGVYAWIDENLLHKESNIERIINLEHQKQAELQLSIGNCITGMREVDALNWKVNFEKLSYVEQILKKDPSGIYGKMDFESRDHYRHEVEMIAHRTKVAESVVARKAVECAELSEDAEYDYKKHVGYYLIDEGVQCLREKLRSSKGKRALENHFKKQSTVYYIGTIVAGTIIIDTLICIVSYISEYNFNPQLWKYVLGFVAALIPCSEIVNSLLNWSISRLVMPRFIPKMELGDGIPDEAKAIVVIPTILNNEKRVHELISDMEIYYLANEEKNLYFALLGDFKDGKSQCEENDSLILKAAFEDIKLLNKKYGDGEDIFYFFNRYRVYNEKQNMWMGWERKRGKLMEFNALLRGNNKTTYDSISGDIKKLQQVKYVITLDADTKLPRDGAKRLIGAMYHVLNRPYFDKKSKTILRGHGLMQPRISVSTLCADKTLFSRVFSGETGFDVYTTAISDVYEDVFDEGIFTGKGIYDVDLFNEILKDEIPENAVLSHDLLEGSYVRAALLTDVELIDGYPAYYNSSAKRLHRWVRGDWQLLPWIFKKSPLNTISKWKITDNLRRSLLSPSIIILIALSLSILPGMENWLIIAFIAILFPILFDVSEAVVSPIRGIGLSGKIENTRMVIEQFILIFCFLPYMTYLMLDAIIRTLYRLLVSKRNMLEWQTAADVEANSGRKLKDYIKEMWGGSLISILILSIAFARSMDDGLFMLPSCILWFLSPYIAYYISIEKNNETVSALACSDKELLRRIGRKTWSYFEDFVNSENNWLAPDNYQECPAKGVAHRTSPTNMAMGLISNIAAYDLGYISIMDVVYRIDKILTGMNALEKFKGHFYNWYDTKTKKPLGGKYVSTVDSGNLVGYLWVASRSLEEYKAEPIINKMQEKGLCDTLRLAEEEIENELEIKNYYTDIIGEIEEQELDITSYKNILHRLKEMCVKIEIPKDRSLYWNEKVKNMVNCYIAQLQCFIPWMDSLMEAPQEFSEMCDKINETVMNEPLSNVINELDKIKESMLSVQISDNSKEWKECITNQITKGSSEIQRLLQSIEALRNELEDMGDKTDFSILYDDKRQIFSIGYNVEKDGMDNCYYDLLASEARQASFIAIAKRDVEQRHWFKLGRALTLMGGEKGLVSWSGTMFEYFMPLLIMRSFPNTLINETYNAVLKGQKKYCRERNVPWGISESAFYSFDINKNYQYKAFGVPGIGLKRGLENELVISPYSTVMALMIDRSDGMKNLKELVHENMEGRYGFYEAADYTPQHLSKGKNKAIVKCFMVHHEGMSLMSLNNVLNDNIFQKRFHSVPKVKATELLLQERMPKRLIYDREYEAKASDISIEKQNLIARKFTTAYTEIPETHIMSNGRYSLMISNRGSGYAKKDDIMVYRWREDVTNDDKGMFFYIKNLNSGDYWSSAYEPCKREGNEYDITFSMDKAEFKRRDGNITTYTEIAVSYEDNAEVRKISVTNHSEHTRDIEITSYMEVTLSPYNADIAHPAFGNLFIETEYIDKPRCIVASRRPRSKEQETPWLMHTVAVEGDTLGSIQYETNRANFIGRGRTTQNPKVMEGDTPLKNFAGAVLDPIVSIRIRLKIAPGKTLKVAYTTGTASSREEAIELAEKYKEMGNISRVFELSWTQSQVEMKYLGIKSAQINLYQNMASRMLFLSPLLRKRETYIKCIYKGQSALWSYGISGDLPIILVITRNNSDLQTVRQVITAHEYISLKGLKIDLVILNEESSSYMQSLQEAVRELVLSSHLRDKMNSSGGVFIYSSSTMKEEDTKLLMGISRLVIDTAKGSLLKQITDVNDGKYNVIKEEDIEVKEKTYSYKNSRFEHPALEYFNEFGGFDIENKQYVISLKDYLCTPAPWINVISNSKFGFHVSESGVAYTWYKNSRENKLTVWSNDSVVDGEAEEIYLRDEDTGSYWSISPKPIRDQGEYIIEHGFGYSNFRHEKNGILGHMTMFVPVNDSVKICTIKLKNLTDSPRKLSVTYYARLVLGVTPEITAQYISTYINSEKEYIYAKNPYSDHFGNLICYMKCIGGEDISFTGNRNEFIGRGGSISSPSAMRKIKLSGDAGGGLDPCAAVNAKISLKPMEEKTFVLLLGEDESLESAEQVMEAYSSKEAVQKMLEEVKSHWNGILSDITVHTPDKSMDILLNGWLMYQVISCRLWARTAFYQSGGAYGFRDQLQDVMSAVYVDPDITKKQIVYSASRQFLEGDVQHWWHPVVNSGIRTRFSDDLLWLPYVTCDYIKCTGDYEILNEKAGYLEDEPLREGEDERYNIAGSSSKEDSIYEHCVAAIEKALKFGEHNIPLMGSGDWNDGMSTVGNKGKGESVWLGWFLYSILEKFSPLCKYKGDIERAERYEKLKVFISENLEKNAWDGSWYRRAYFDDGTPLGSIKNDECEIDSLSQSWAVISGAAPRRRTEIAMDALEKYLVNREKGIVMLLTPPFDKSKLEPGYIKGYVPGVRENGAQYTHAAVWVCLAMTKLGFGNKACEIFHMINPVNHSKTYLDCETYKVEPYVMAADVYMVSPHEGRGGWTWYTGAAGWMYRTGIEGILGLKLEGNEGFTVEPCIPDEWSRYSMTYKRKECIYNIHISRGSSKCTRLDGRILENGIVPFMDRGVYSVEVIL